MSKEVELTLNTKMKISVDSNIILPSDEEKQKTTGDSDKNCCHSPGGEELSGNNKRGYAKRGSKLIPFIALYTIGIVLFLLLILFDIFSWSWPAKLTVFSGASAVSFLASVWKGYLTNASDDELDYTPQQIERKKSYCDGFIIIGALVAILAGFSGLISGHKLDQRVEDLEASRIRTETAVCDIYRAAGQKCPFRQRDRKQPLEGVWTF